jgi:hypothetical protein
MSKRWPQTFPERFRDKFTPEPFSNCWLWTACRDVNDYGIIRVDGKNMQAHRASWIIHFGEIPQGVNVLHSCDTPPCVNPKHLFLGTQLDNIRDCIAKGRRGDQSGEEHARAKLNATDVLEIRNSGDNIQQLSERFKMSRTAISYIRSRTTWKCI